MNRGVFNEQKVMICVSYPLLGQGLQRMIEGDGATVLINHGCTDGECSLPAILEEHDPDLFVLEFGCEGHEYVLSKGVEAPIIAVNMVNNETYVYQIQRVDVETSADLIELVHSALKSERQKTRHPGQ